MRVGSFAVSRPARKNSAPSSSTTTTITMTSERDKRVFPYLAGNQVARRLLPDARARCIAPAAMLQTRVSEGWAGKPIVLVGLMGAGKTTIGRRLAARLRLPFVDADAEIEAAA